jgi:hypothetical protein
MAAPIRQNQSTSANQDWTISTMEQFLAMRDKASFTALKAEEDAKIGPNMDLSKLPKHIFGQLMVIHALMWHRLLSAQDVGVYFLNLVEKVREKFVGSEEDADLQAYLEECHLMAAYIWSTSKGLTKAVGMLNPPDTNTVKEECNLVQSRLQSRTRASPSPSPSKDKDFENSKKRNKEEEKVGQGEEG